MALAAEDLRIYDNEPDPYLVNLYLRDLRWNGLISTFPWSQLPSIGLKLVSTIEYSNLNQALYYNQIRKELAAGRIVFVVQTKWSSEGTVCLLVSTYNEHLVVQNPASSDEDEAVLDITETSRAYILQTTSVDVSKLTCGPTCAYDPCNCPMFECPHKPATPTFDCSIFKTGLLNVCKASPTVLDFINYMKCATYSCGCPFFRTDSSGCLVATNTESIMIGASLPLDDYASRLTANTNLPASVISELIYLGGTTENFIIAIKESLIGLTPSQEAEVLRQTYNIVFNELVAKYLDFRAYPPILQAAVVSFYALNLNNRDIFFDSDVWSFIKDKDWHKLYKIGTRSQNYQRFKVPRYFDEVIEHAIACSSGRLSNTFGEVLFLISKGNTESSNLVYYHAHLGYLLNNLNIGPDNIRVAIAAIGTTVEVFSPLSSSRSDLINIFNTKVTKLTIESSAKTNLFVGLSKSYDLLSEGARASTGYSPKLVVLFTDGNYTGTVPSDIIRELNANNIRVLILNRHNDQIIMNILKTWSTDAYAYSLANLDTAASLDLTNNIISQLYATGSISLSGGFAVNVFQGQYTFLRYPVSPSGITLTITVNGDPDLISIYASSVFAFPTKDLYDFQAVRSGNKYILSQRGDKNHYRILQTGTSPGQLYLYIGVTSISGTITLSITGDTSVTKLKSCPDECIDCDPHGAVCFICKVGYTYAVDSCEGEDELGFSADRIYVFESTGDNRFLQRLNLDYKGIRKLTLIVVGSIAGSLVVIFFILGIGKLEWTVLDNEITISTPSERLGKIKSPKARKESGEEAKPLSPKNEHKLERRGNVKPKKKEKMLKIEIVDDSEDPEGFTRKKKTSESSAKSQEKKSKTPSSHHDIEADFVVSPDSKHSRTESSPDKRSQKEKSTEKKDTKISEDDKERSGLNLGDIKPKQNEPPMLEKFGSVKSLRNLFKLSDRSIDGRKSKENTESAFSEEKSRMKSQADDKEKSVKSNSPKSFGGSKRSLFDDASDKVRTPEPKYNSGPDEVIEGGETNRDDNEQDDENKPLSPSGNTKTVFSTKHDNLQEIKEKEKEDSLFDDN